MTDQSRRTIDEVLSPEFSATLQAVDVTEIRRRRDLAREEEAMLSYVRRLIHGKLDILRAELARRTRDDDVTDEITQRLTKVLADRGANTRRGGRSALPSEPSQSIGRRTVERLINEDHLARLPELSVSDIEEVVTRLVDHEKKVSELRRAIFEVIDRLDNDLVTRYRSGAASPEDVLGPRSQTSE